MTRTEGFAIAIIIGVLLGADTDWSWTTVGIGATTAFALLLPLGRRAVMGRVLVLGLTLGTVNSRLQPLGPVLEGPVAVRGRITSAGQGFADLRSSQTKIVGQTMAMEGPIRLNTGSPPPRVGDYILAWGEAQPECSPLIPGLPAKAWAARVARIRTCVSVNAWRPVEPSERPRVPSGRFTGILPALAHGDRTLLSSDLVIAMRQTGTSHLLAISGTHVGAISIGFYASISLALRFISLIRPRGVPTHWVGSLCAIGCWLFCNSAGWPIGGIRACIFVSVAALAQLFSIQIHWRATGWLAAAAIALNEPGLLFNIGYQLSFSAVIGLLTLMPAVMAWRPHRVPSWLWTPAAVSGCATVCTAPVLAMWTGEIPTWSMLANVFAVPAVSFGWVPLALAWMVCPEWLHPGLAVVTDAVVGATLNLLTVFHVEPIALHLPIAFGVPILLAILTHRPLLVVPFLFTSSSPEPKAEVQLTIPALQQGWSAWIEGPEGTTLIDGGGSAHESIRWWTTHPSPSVQTAVLTTQWAGNIQGFSAILRRTPPRELWIPPGSRGDPDLRALLVWAAVHDVRVIPDPIQNQARQARATLANPRSRSLAVEIPGLPAVAAPGIDSVGARYLTREPLSHVDILIIPPWGSAGATHYTDWGNLEPRWVLAGHRRVDHDRASWAKTAALALDTARVGTVVITQSAGTLTLRSWHPTYGWSPAYEDMDGDLSRAAAR